MFVPVLPCEPGYLSKDSGVSICSYSYTHRAKNVLTFLNNKTKQKGGGGGGVDKIKKSIYKFIMANISAIWQQQAAHTTIHHLLAAQHEPYREKN